MGKLTHAPVFYVVAQVTHSPILKLDSFVPELQDRLRKEGFPGYRAQKGMTLQIVADAKTPEEPKVTYSEVIHHVFSSRDSMESFVVGTDGFGYQTVKYETIEIFIEKFTKGMNAVQSVLAPDSFTRIGLRFLDAVTPPEGGEPSDYIQSQFLGLQDPVGDDKDWMISHAFSETVLSRHDRFTKVRVITRSADLTYPPDLVKTAPTLPERFAQIKGVHTLIDSDASCTFDAGLEFSADAIIDRLRLLKSDIRDTFKSVVTEVALKDWA